VLQAAVIALTSLIYPVLFCGDYRPYFTIHDAEVTCDLWRVACGVQCLLSLLLLSFPSFPC
jgi:hypothetical protein